MSYKFINNFFHFNEIKDYYDLSSKENIFNSLNDDVKNDLSIVTNNLYETFSKKLENSKQYSINLDGIDLIDGFNCYILIHVNIFPETKQISLIVNNDNNYITLQNDIYQKIVYSDIDIVSENNFKNYIYNILFFCYLIVREYKYSPLFYNFYHKNDIIEMNNNRKRNIKLFGKNEECCICYDQTVNKTICDHSLCLRCLNKIPNNNKKCPLCRTFLTIEDDMDYNDVRTATIYVHRE